MIALDNGPPDGDYVRYIEQRIALARATAANAPVATEPKTGVALSSPTFVPMAALSTGRVATPRAGTQPVPATANRMPTPGNAVDTAIPRGLAGILIGLALIVFGVVAAPVRSGFVVVGLLALAFGARTLTRAVGARVVTVR